MTKMLPLLFFYLSVVSVVTSSFPDVTSPPTVGGESRADDVLEETGEEPPEGYYAFVESPNATPPRVRPPPYRQVAAECAGAGEGGAEGGRAQVSAHNLCGDLNRGTIPRNPMGHSHNGDPYPFELIRNQTLRFLSRTLPVLRADAALPRVRRVPAATAPAHNRLEERSERAVQGAGEEPRAESVLSAEPGAERGGSAREREGRKFCEGSGIFCMLYRAFNGDSESSAGVERREDPGVPPHPQNPPHHRYEGPPTPCPARVEYATPVFARNYQALWRYVVQIPYEGYFTQTVEVTRCMQSRCHYLEGGCLSSPRWVSLLVAELHYPQHEHQQNEYQQYAQSRGAAPEPPAEKPSACDGHDELGCFQVRLYYDWFLVPGSCKCWRPDYFARYVRRKHNNEL